MDPTTKKAMVILLLILIAFAGVLAWSLTRDDGGDSQPGAWLTGMGSALTAKSALTRPEIWGGCGNGSEFVVMAAAPCETLVRSSNTTVRTLRIQMVSGLRGRVLLTPRGENGVSCSIPLRTDAPRSPELQVLQDGADLTLRCEVPLPGGAPCRFALVR